MKQVLLHGKEVAVQEVPPPAPGNKQVLVANVFSLISTGTESIAITSSKKSLLKRALERPELVTKVFHKIREEGLKKTLGKVSEKITEYKSLGYSSAGVVLTVGNEVVDINPGDRVACAGVGFANHAEIVAVPRNLVARIPDDVSFEEAAFTTLGAISMHGMRRANCQFGETIAIIGLGLLGLIAVQIAKASGLKAICLDIDPQRVALAKSLGVDHALTIDGETVNTIQSITGDFGVDAAVIYAATESSEPVNLAFDLCRHKGRVVGVGAFGMNFDREKMYQKELDFLMSTSYGPGRYDREYEEESVDYPIGYVRWTENRNMQSFLELLSNKKIDVKQLISQIYPIEKASEAYTTLLNSEKKPLALLFKYDYQKYSEMGRLQTKVEIMQLPKKVTEKIRVGLVGAGGFAKEVHLPNLRKLSELYELKTVVTQHGTSAFDTAKKFGFENASTDVDDVLKDPEIDLVMISTRHGLHYPLVMKALESGKYLFVEKPLCLKPDELENIKEKVAETGLHVFVGFNRRYSPFIKYIKKEFEKLGAPQFLIYRVNAGFIPADHWVHDPEEGGGRLIGEGCHFFDTFSYLVGKDREIANQSCEGIPVDSQSIVARDNFAATVKYSDGSLAVLTYIATGNTNTGKEYLEAHCKNISFIMNDFIELKAYGIKIGASGASKNKWNPSSPDKGHRQQLIEIAKALKGEENEAISFEEVYRTMKVTFECDALIRGQKS